MYWSHRKAVAVAALTGPDAGAGDTVVRGNADVGDSAVVGDSAGAAGMDGAASRPGMGPADSLAPPPNGSEIPPTIQVSGLTQSYGEIEAGSRRDLSVPS